MLRGTNLFPGSWTVDGRSILINGNVTEVAITGYDIGLITIGDTTPRWILKSKFSERQPQVSPDGRILAYTSNRSGPAEIYVQSLGGAGVAVQVSDSGGHSPRWSRDGKTLFYLNQATIVPASLTGGPALSVASRRVVSSGISMDNSGMNSNWDDFPYGKLLVIDQGGVTAGRRVALIQNWPALARSMGAEQ